MTTWKNKSLPATGRCRPRKLLAIHEPLGLCRYGPPAKPRLNGRSALTRHNLEVGIMDRAALDRHAVPNGGDRLVEPGRAIDDEELGPPQAALDEIVEDGTPGLGALATHALDRQHHLLAVLAYADDDEQRDGSRLAVKPHAHHSPVENEPHDRLFGQRAGVPCVPIAPHLAPGSAHRVLAHGTAKQGGERTAHGACWCQ